MFEFKQMNKKESNENLADSLHSFFPDNEAPWSKLKAAAIRSGRGTLGATNQIAVPADVVQSYIYDVQRTWKTEGAAKGVAVIDLRDLYIQGEIDLIPQPGQFPIIYTGHTTFTDSVGFHGAEFMSNAVFENTEFKKTCSFQDTIFHAVTSFNNSIFHDSTSFIGAHFSKAPKFHETKLHGDTSFRGATFSRTKTDNDYEAYRRLRELMHNMKASLQEGEFFVYEQRTLRNLQFVGARKKYRLSLEASVSWLYDVICRYGQSIGRPLFWLLFINVGFAGIFYFACDGSIIHDKITEIGRVPPAIGLTLQNLFNPFGLFGKALPFGYGAPWVVYASIIQSLLSLIIIALVLVAVRRRFRKGTE